MNKKEIIYHSVVYGLKSVIVVHGPITKKNIISAAKRITGQLSKFNEIDIPDQPVKEELRFIIAEKYKELLVCRERLKSPDEKREEKPKIEVKYRVIKSLIRSLEKVLTKHRRNVE